MTVTEQRFRLPGSSRPLGAAIEPVDPKERLTVTVYIRRDRSKIGGRHAERPPDPLAQARLAPSARSYLRPEDAAAVFGASRADLDAVTAFAKQHGLDVVEQSIAKRLVRLAGSVDSINEAFGVVLRHYERPEGGRYRSNDGDVQLPAELTGVVEGVLGLDNRKMVSSRPRFAAQTHKTPGGKAPGSKKAAGSKAHGGKTAGSKAAGGKAPAGSKAAGAGTLEPNTYTPPDVAKLFNFPASTLSGQCVAVLAFNGQVMSTEESAPGGYEKAALDGYFTGVLGQAAPTITDVVVQGPGNQPGDGSKPNDSSAEVLLDLCTVASVAQGANVAVYFTEFTEEGWVNAIKAAVNDVTNKPEVISISYGNPEDDEGQSAWTAQTIQLVNEAFEQAAAQGMTICCASGDSGSGDEPGATTEHVDFPASSPWVLGCGGIRLEAEVATSTIQGERVWNDLAGGNGATGGGVSRLFPVPDWQATANVPPNADGSGKTGRGVPDVAGLADPETPLWVLMPGGQPGGIGGTSAAAPLWSALIALLNQQSPARLGFFNPQLYEHLKDSLVDIVQGNNGNYAAGPGWDACTGWGRPDGGRLLQGLEGAAAGPGAGGTAAGSGSGAGAAGSGEPPGGQSGAGGGTAASGEPGGAPAEQRLFADPQPGADEASFQVDNTSDAYYKSPYYKLHREQLQPIPAPRASPPRLELAQVLGEPALGTLLSARKISFHAVGDTGPSEARQIGAEAGVADAMTGDLVSSSSSSSSSSGGQSPAFLFHLGDVIYNFGEPQYYYDQFYEPFRSYGAPIFAIPGNHDGFPEENQATLFAFLRNFCAATPGPSQDAGAIVRSTMTQPGVYFTLDAPFVSIVGLYSNVLEGPGVISSEGGRYPLGDEQLQFLTEELTRLKPQREAGERAVILAVHHPPLSVDATHGGIRGMSEDIDKACESAGLRPDAILSGHAHLYQRYTRTVDGAEVPYIVSGSGGHGLTKPQANISAENLPEGYALTVKPIMEYGYLTLTVDMSSQTPTLTAAFEATSGGETGLRDTVTIDLSTRKIIPSS
jgi:kumamolisin